MPQPNKLKNNTTNDIELFTKKQEKTLLLISTSRNETELIFMIMIDLLYGIFFFLRCSFLFF